MIPDVILEMSRDTQIVITEEAAEALSLPRNTTAGQVQDAMAKPADDYETMDNTDPYVEL